MSPWDGDGREGEGWTDYGSDLHSRFISKWYKKPKENNKMTIGLSRIIYSAQLFFFTILAIIIIRMNLWCVLLVLFFVNLSGTVPTIIRNFHC